VRKNRSASGFWCVEVVLLARAVVHVLEALTDEPDLGIGPAGGLDVGAVLEVFAAAHRIGALGTQCLGQPVLYVLLRNLGAAAVGILLLAPQERPLVETAPVVLGRLEHVVDIRNEARAPACFAEHLGQGGLILGDGSPTRRADEVALQPEIGVDERIDAPPRVDGAPCGKRRQRLGVGAVKDKGLLGKRVEVRRPHLPPRR
jgi:hypothetical protein